MSKSPNAQAGRPNYPTIRFGLLPLTQTIKTIIKNEGSLYPLLSQVVDNYVIKAFARQCKPIAYPAEISVYDVDLRSKSIRFRRRVLDHIPVYFEPVCNEHGGDKAV